jgi:hypothetical protein
MANIADLGKILDVEGVDQYIVLGPGGQLLSHNMDNHIILSSMIITCASICKLINAEHFQYLVFAQEDGKDFFIFPVGKHYLAVIKKAESRAQDLPRDIAAFIRDLVEK